MIGNITLYEIHCLFYDSSTLLLRGITVQLEKTQTMEFNLELYVKDHESDFVIVSQTTKKGLG